MGDYNRESRTYIMTGFCGISCGECECGDFPCSRLNPASDRAEILPHNLKAFNLCYIQKHGLEEFAQHAAEFKNKYYKGKMAVGKGPQME